ncbi:MAG: dihydroorotate dehydrogenase electron transfer subunit [Candidatus Aenigmarchaeota archaeon]|nr:dihydroorotate dehydrogenase electron transfer subunit [Candidatus Aenigmarchaeota archaeon]
MSKLPEMVKITKITQENPYVKTFFLDTEIEAKPGQFVMLWLPEIDEKPFSISYIGKETGITVEEKGKFTKAMFGLKEGQKIGIRGPYGNGFTPKENSCIVAGGCGIAPLSTLAEKMNNSVLIMGTRTKDRLIFENRFPNANIVTDDGTVGKKGFTTDVLEEFLKKGNIKNVYTCGPEIMMKKVFEICEKHNIECQASLERFMKCGFGVCGQCEVGGVCVCKEGPVILSDKLRKMKDFGSHARLKSGKRVPISEYAKWRCV